MKPEFRHRRPNVSNGFVIAVAGILISASLDSTVRSAFAQSNPQDAPTVLRGSEAFLEKPRILHEFAGNAPGEEFGWVARKVGDLDADGVLDFATSAPSSNAAGPAAGRIIVISSRTGKTLFTRSGRAGDRYGNIVCAAGDVNADGTPDVLVGAPGTTRRPGRVEVLSGKDGRVLLEAAGSQGRDRFGLKGCAVGDVDDDGHDDLAIGATGADTADAKDSGRVTVISGRDGSTLYTIDGETAGDAFGSALDGTVSVDPPLLVVGAMKQGERNVGRAYVYRLGKKSPELAFTIDPDETSANLGQYFVTVLGDIDGDSFPDVYASDWNNAAKGPGTGRVFVHSGRTGERILTLTGRRAGEGFGTSVSDAGDVDGDGRADLIVGAWQARDGAAGGGRCSLHSGRDGSWIADYTSTQPGDTLGFDATGIGDVDVDGGVDFLLTSAWSAVAGPKSGRVWIVAGPAPGAAPDAEPGSADSDRPAGDAEGGKRGG